MADYLRTHDYDEAMNRLNRVYKRIDNIDNVIRSDDFDHLLYHYDNIANHDKYDYAIYTGGWKLIKGKEL